MLSVNSILLFHGNRVQTVLYPPTQTFFCLVTFFRDVRKKAFVGGYLYMGEVDKPVNGRDQWIIEVYQIRIGEGTDRIKQCDG